jgi:hypothetical protein
VERRRPTPEEEEEDEERLTVFPSSVCVFLVLLPLFSPPFLLFFPYFFSAIALPLVCFPLLAFV